ncbi:hypothetical protein BN874_270005 [Candidatus Contendobacter odensis Run_B_J11]|uniref:Uncharacterized protein n=1 Tax=Candidatus Contendobacter odensis Run_B_J11 TaxID=1400861 RepID=A0A7U7GCH3_9GAMM|nr:hypothetical protein BN874_270005 [Candidatus Contendobacter odensis Run_B_J11]
MKPRFGMRERLGFSQLRENKNGADEDDQQNQDERRPQQGCKAYLIPSLAVKIKKNKPGLIQGVLPLSQLISKLSGKKLRHNATFSSERVHFRMKNAMQC